MTKRLTLSQKQQKLKTMSKEEFLPVQPIIEDEAVDTTLIDPQTARFYLDLIFVINEHKRTGEDYSVIIKKHNLK